MAEIKKTVPADPLGEALHFLRMMGVFYCSSEFSEPWGLDIPSFENCMMLHLVTSGRCHLEIDGESPCIMNQHDLVLVPHGNGHILHGDQSARATPLFDTPRELLSERYETLFHGGGGDKTVMMCAVVRFEHPAAFHLLSMLPKTIRVHVGQNAADSWAPALMDLLAAEAKAMKPGGETVITRLADILVIHVIRSWMAGDEGTQTGWLAAMRDERIGQAITLIHREPAADWSVASLAEQVAMSRSAFAARFTELVGEPAMRYVTRWRMHLALIRLKEHDESLFEMAEHLGYRSEAAFSRAFKRFIGISPGAARKQPDPLTLLPQIALSAG